MIQLNQLLNRIHEWNDSDHNIFQRFVGSRAANLTATMPIEMLAVAQNVFIAPVQLVGITLGAGAKVISYISGSQSLKDFANEAPNLKDLLRTVVRIIAYTAGTFLTATVGIISPETNFKAHCAIGLAINEREEMLKAKQLQEEIHKLEAQKKEEEERMAEMEELEKLAQAYATADKIELESDEAIIEDAGAMFAKSSALGGDVESEQETQVEEAMLVRQEETKDSQVSHEQQHSMLTNVAQGVFTMGEQLVNGTYNAAVFTVTSASEAARKIGNIATFGYFFAPAEKA